MYLKKGHVLLAPGSTEIKNVADHSAGSLSAYLRAATRSNHDAVDAAFGASELTSRNGYRNFLLAHARVVPLVERLLAPSDMIDGWEGRTAALFQDLAALGLERPREIDFVLPDGEAARWGALYVVEGSRLGGAMLVRGVPEGLPTAYLADVHGHGKWRELLAALDAAEQDMVWRQDAVAGAKAMFGAYLLATRIDAEEPDSASKHQI
ncbi:biliverdin-producing heme oxygenase [Novosphingobium sp.]|uniref:biliverdin-producing heme oxygenase n=1 Tax=Novosphingobium sp. TaxID=1874826 RepID=UPI003B525BD7